MADPGRAFSGGSRPRSLAFLATLMLVAAACTGGGGASRGVAFHPTGGTVRVGLLLNGSMNFCSFILCGGQFTDPQIEYSIDGYEIERCCLLRTLLSYSGQDTSHGGTILRPDVAAALPSVSADGLTWTFRLKRGLHYAPPLQHVEITSADFVRSIERLLSAPPSDMPPAYGDELDYYLGRYLDLTGIIQGAAQYQSGKSAHISGLETPEPHTLVVHLTHRNGGFGYLLSLPSTAPIPPNPFHPGARFGVAQGHARFYMRYLVSSGPYMIQGADKIDFSKRPAQQVPASGNRPNALVLVRNPSWQPSTDGLRTAQPDRIVLTPVNDARDAKRLVRSGALDLVMDWSASPADLSSARLASATRHVGTPRDWVIYLEFNLALPPLDDVHVRKAINFAIARDPLLPVVARTGVGGVPDKHFGLDSEENNLLFNFDPYSVATGDLASAHREMRQSRYDTNHDGRCDAPACRGLQMWVHPTQASEVAAAPLVARDLRRIGIDLRVVVPSNDRFNATYQDPSIHVGIRLTEWGKDLTSGATYFPPLVASPRTGVVTGWANLPKLGATPRDLHKWGYRVRSVPNVDGRVQSCLSLTFGAQTRCWADLDQYLMTQVVPWAPLVSFTNDLVVARRVRSVTFDQSASSPVPSLDRIVLAHGPTATRSPAVPGPVPAIPDGVYRTTITKADLYRFDPHYDANGVDENTATQTITLRRGWFEMISTARKHPVGNVINVGTYRGSERRVVFATTAPSQNAIATPPMRWRFDGHALHFRFLGCGKLNTLDPHNPHLCGDIRVLYEAHPWVKVG